MKSCLHWLITIQNKFCVIRIIGCILFFCHSPKFSWFHLNVKTPKHHLPRLIFQAMWWNHSTVTISCLNWSLLWLAPVHVEIQLSVFVALTILCFHALLVFIRPSPLLIGDDFRRVWEGSWRKKEGSACSEDWGEESGLGQRLAVHATALE